MMRKINHVKVLKSSIITARDIRSALHKRSVYSDKYSNGRVLIIGGSSSYYGAPVLSTNAAYQSIAALRIGAGYVKAFVPKSILNAARKLSPNTIIQPLGKDCIVFNSTIRQQIQRSDVIALGPGIGNNAKQISAAAKIVKYAIFCNKKIIVDAEAIAMFKKLKPKKPNVLITPHQKEFMALTEIKMADQQHIQQRAAQVAQAAKRMNLVIVLKGHSTIVTDGQNVKINRAKTAALATMGTGDVLVGMIAAFAVNNDLYNAALAAVHLHSQIADELYKSKGNHIIATDIIDQIAISLKKLDRRYL